MTEGQTATLSWSSTNATSCVASGSWIGSQPLSGSQAASPTAGSFAYALSCTGPGGTAGTSATLTVTSSSTPPPLPTVNLVVSPASVNAGESVTLTWSSTNATSCAATDQWGGFIRTGGGGTQSVAVSKAPSGNEVDTSPSTADVYTYTLTCTGTAGSASKSVTLSVEPASGTGATALFNGPTGLSTDSADNLYVADENNYTVRKITPAGVVTIVAGLAGTSGYVDGTGIAARFRALTDVAADAAGNVYGADALGNTIRKIAPDAVVTTFAGMPDVVGYQDGTGQAAEFSHPAGVATDGVGNVYVADTVNYSIRKITPAGAVTTLAGSTTVGCTDGTGSAATFTAPKAIATDSSGNVFEVDGCNVIRMITPNGVVTTLAGSGGQGSADGTGAGASFRSPQGIATDSAGNLYVADTDNDTIRKVTPTGVVTTLAGTAGMAGSTDGTGPAARFWAPHGVAVDSAGNVYVSDTANQTIRKVTPAGVVTTIAGQVGVSGSNN